MSQPSTEALLKLISDRYTPRSQDSKLFFSAEKFLDPLITPSIFAYSASGIRLQTNSKKYNGEVLDFCGQTVNCILGENDPWVTANIIAFMESGHPNFLSTSIGQSIFYEIPLQIKKISKMHEDSFVNHRLNNGSDATSFAIEMTCRHAAGKKTKLISFKGSYHGQGHLPYGASDLQTGMRFFDKLKNVVFLKAPSHSMNPKTDRLSKSDEKIIEKLLKIGKDAFAIIIEPIQFNNNGNTPSQAFMKALRDSCDKLQLPLIFDEIQTGWGWLGTMTAAEYYGVWPDVMALSKSITAGYGPLSMVISRSKFRSSGAFGARTNGSDVRSLVAAKAVMERMLGSKQIPVEIENTKLGKELKNGLLLDFQRKSNLLLEYLKELRSYVNSKSDAVKIGKIKGLGLARMIEIKNHDGKFDSKLTKQLQHELLVSGGVFVRTPSNSKVHTLFIKMPIVANEEEMKEGFDRMKSFISKFKMTTKKHV